MSHCQSETIYNLPLKKLVNIQLAIMKPTVASITTGELLKSKLNKSSSSSTLIRTSSTNQIETLVTKKNFSSSSTSSSTSSLAPGTITRKDILAPTEVIPNIIEEEFDLNDKCEAYCIDHPIATPSSPDLKSTKYKKQIQLLDEEPNFDGIDKVVPNNLKSTTFHCKHDSGQCFDSIGKCSSKTKQKLVSMESDKQHDILDNNYGFQHPRVSTATSTTSLQLPTCNKDRNHDKDFRINVDQKHNHINCNWSMSDNVDERYLNPTTTDACTYSAIEIAEQRNVTEETNDANAERNQEIKIAKEKNSHCTNSIHDCNEYQDANLLHPEKEDEASEEYLQKIYLLKLSLMKNNMKKKMNNVAVPLRIRRGVELEKITFKSHEELREIVEKRITHMERIKEKKKQLKMQQQKKLSEKDGDDKYQRIRISKNVIKIVMKKRTLMEDGDNDSDFRSDRDRKAKIQRSS